MFRSDYCCLKTGVLSFKIERSAGIPRWYQETHAVARSSLQTYQKSFPCRVQNTSSTPMRPPKNFFIFLQAFFRLQQLES